MQTALNLLFTKNPVFSVCVILFLLSAIIIICWALSSIKKYSELNKRLNFMATHDTLTNAMNQNCFLMALEDFSNKNDTSFGCIYIDVNGLHEINNHLGHYAGDEMLQATANALRHNFPRKNVYRIGGDEFAVLLPLQAKQNVAEKISDIRQKLRKEGYEISVGLEWGGDPDRNTDSIVRAAEAAMQQDKQIYYKENGNDRLCRTLDQKLEQLVTEKQDADTFLSVLAPEFKGVYFVDMDKDMMRNLFMPSYFEELLGESGDVFSKALFLYADRFVAPSYQQQFIEFCDYGTLNANLGKTSVPEFTYQKQDGSWIQLRILKFKTYTAQQRETLWIFSTI